jgi:hypothetical protein
VAGRGNDVVEEIFLLEKVWQEREEENTQRNM